MNSKWHAMRTIVQSKLAQGTMISFIIKLAGTFLALISGVLLARILGPTQYGFYSYALSIVTILLIPATLGLPLLIVRFTVSYQVTEAWSVISGLLIRAKQFARYSSILVVIIFLPIGYILDEHISSVHFYTFSIGLFAIPLLSYNAIRSAAMRGFGSILYAQLTDSIIRPILFILIILLLLQSQTSITSEVAMTINLFLILATFVLGIYWLRKFTPIQVIHSTPEFRTKEWMIALVPFILTQGVVVLNNHVTILMVGMIDGPESTGIFQVAIKGSEIINFALAAVNLVIAPQVAKLYTQNKINQLQRLMTMSSIAITIYSLLCTMILIFFGKPLVNLVFGSAYDSSASALVILLFGQLVNSMIGSLGMLLSMTGHQKDIFKGTVFVMVLLVAMNLLFIPLFGVIGAAASSSIGIILWNLIMWYYVRTRIGINPTAFGKLKGKTQPSKAIDP